MTRILKHLICVLALVAGVCAQERKPAPAPPPSTTFENTRTVPVPPILTSPSLMSEAYAFPTQDRAAIRDLQYQNDRLEIENQKMQVRMEQNKAKQAELLDKIRSLAFDFANKNQINLDQYELDPVNVAFVKKQAPAK